MKSYSSALTEKSLFTVLRRRTPRFFYSESQVFFGNQGKASSERQLPSWDKVYLIEQLRRRESVTPES